MTKNPVVWKNVKKYHGRVLGSFKDASTQVYLGTECPICKKENWFYFTREDRLVGGSGDQQGCVCHACGHRYFFLDLGDELLWSIGPDECKAKKYDLGRLIKGAYLIDDACNSLKKAMGE